MPDIAEGETVEVQGSGSNRYKLQNIGGVYSCTCPAWLHQSQGIEARTCKHLRKYRGDEAEQQRLGTTDLAGKPIRAARAAGGGAAEEKGEEPPVLLAHKWEMDVDLTGWWMSEKLDGVRAYWDGKIFISRLGNRYHAPDWFVDKLPDHPLDGELWSGRKKFQQTISIVRRQDKSDAWKKVSFVVFDAPAHGGTFEERLAHCDEVLTKAGTPYARALEQQTCKGYDHLKEELARVEALGGEGLMMRKPGSKYEAGRSHTLLKVKSFHDAEAKVLAYVKGAGRHKGRMGALLVVMPDGTKFSVGTGFSDAERENPPELGSIITFRYQELSDGGVPRFPSFVCVREDFAWPGEGGASTKSVSRKVAAGSTNPGNVGASPAPAPVVAAPKGVRRFEKIEGGAGKFWEIEVVGAKHRVRYGTFEVKVKSFDDAAAAAKAANERIAEKIRKGFAKT